MGGRHVYCKSCFNWYCCNRWVERKKREIEKMGGKCSQCGVVDHYSIYAFHHKDPKEKEADWTQMRLWSEDRMREELKKNVF